MADGNWYGVGATRAMGCTQCTCEARDYVYCVDLCPGKYTNGTKESFLKSFNYHFFLLRHVCHQISAHIISNNSNILQFSEVNVHAYVNPLLSDTFVCSIKFHSFYSQKETDVIFRVY